MSSAAWPTSTGSPRVTGWYPGRSSSSTDEGQYHSMVALEMSLGRSISTGPGRPVVATWKAAATTRGISSTSLMSQLCLVMPMVTPVMSHSWKASVPMEAVATWPDTTMSGVESM